MVKSVLISLVLCALVLWMMHLDVQGREEDPQGLLAQKEGCRFDWVSQGRYCQHVLWDGSRVASRAY